MLQILYITLLLLTIGSIVLTIFYFIRMLSEIRPEKQKMAGFLGPFILASNSIHTTEGKEYKLKFIVCILITIGLFILVSLTDNAINELG